VAIWWAVTLAVSFGLFLQKNWGVWERPRQAIIEGWDEWNYYLWLPALGEQGSVDFRPLFSEVPNWSAAWHQRALAAQPTPAGLLPNKYPLGWALASAPWFAVGTVVANATGNDDNALPTAGSGVTPRGATGPGNDAGTAPGFHPWQQWWVLFGQWVYGVVGLAAAVFFLARFFGRNAASYAVLAGWWCGPLLVYQTQRVTLTHSLVFALTAALWLATERILAQPERLGRWVLLGLGAGLLVSVRPVDGVLLLYPAGMLGPLLWRQPAARKGAIAAGVAALLALVPLLAAWKALYGSWVVYTYAGESFDWAHPQLWQVLFSPLHGWMYWHPAMLAGTLGLLAAVAFGRAGERPRVFWMLATLALLTYLNAAWWCWWFGPSFGNRGFVGIEPAVMFGLAWLGTRAPARARGILWVAGLALAAWNLNLLWLMHRWPETGLKYDVPVTYHQAATATWRYYFGPTPGSGR
jgi:hypothetical protein